MGAEIAALGSLLGLTSAFALVGTGLAAWMAWRIVEKAGLPGWTGLGAVLITLTGIGTVVPLILLWVFAFMRWPRDEHRAVLFVPGAPSATMPNPQLAPPRPALQAATAAAGQMARGWQLSGAGHTLSFNATSGTWIVTGGTAEKASDLSLPDPSIGRPHARLLVAGDRLGLEDLGSPGGTMIDGARLLPEHGPRDISAARTIRFGTLDLALSRP
jgi:hypothetical protein